MITYSFIVQYSMLVTSISLSYNVDVFIQATVPKSKPISACLELCCLHTYIKTLV